MPTAVAPFRTTNGWSSATGTFHGLVADVKGVGVFREDEVGLERGAVGRDVGVAIDDDGGGVGAALGGGEVTGGVVRLLVRAGGDFDLAVRIVADVGDEVAADGIAVAGEVNGERHVHPAAVVGGGGAEADVLEEVMGPELFRRFAPALLDEAREFHRTKRVAGTPADEGVVDSFGASAWFAIEPAVGPEGGVQRAEAAEVIVGAAVRAGEALGGRQPVGGDVSPEQFEHGAGDFAFAVTRAERFEQAEVNDVHAVVRRAAILMCAVARSIEDGVVEAAVAFLRDVGFGEALAEEDEVGGVHEGDVGVGGTNFVAAAAFGGERENLSEFGASVGGYRVAVADPKERAGLHAEVNGVLVVHFRVRPVPAEVAAGFAFRVAVLELRGKIEDAGEAFGMAFGLAPSQRGGEEIARGEVELVGVLATPPCAFGVVGGVLDDVGARDDGKEDDGEQGVHGARL